jgi:drug/metabolite transporter (DMT)-like permease
MRVAAAEFGIFSTACLRMGIGALVMLPLLAWRGLLGQMLTNWKQILGISLFTSAIPFACFAFAVLHITTGLSAILNATSPMFAALVAWLWLGQRLTALRVIGMVTGFVGVVLLAGAEAALKGDDVLLSILAMLACLLAALCYGASGNAVKQRMAHLHPWVIAGGTMLGATLWLAIPSLLTLPATAPSAKAWGAMVVAAVLCSAFAFMLYFELMQRVDIARTSSVTYLITVFALFYGALFLDEHITLWMLFCGLVVLVGTALATGLIKRKEPI